MSDRKQSKQAALMAKQGFVPAASAAERTGYHITSIYRMIDNGHVDGTSVGKARYVKLTSLKKYLGEGAKHMKLDDLLTVSAATT